MISCRGDANYPASFKLASIRTLVRVNESAPGSTKVSAKRPDVGYAMIVLIASLLGWAHADAAYPAPLDNLNAEAPESTARCRRLISINTTRRRSP